MHYTTYSIFAIPKIFNMQKLTYAYFYKINIGAITYDRLFAFLGNTGGVG